MITYNEFIKKYLGKKYDYDDYAGCQCVDTAKLYMDKCLGLKPGNYGNAKDYWLNRNKYKMFKEHFDFIPIDNHKPYSKTKLKAGDIGIRTRGTYGHIFIVDHVTDTNITYYDTNGTGNRDALTKRCVPYTQYYITGVLRPKSVHKKVTAKAGLKYYNTLKGDSVDVLPYGTDIDVINMNAGTRKVGGKSYKMCIFRRAGKQYYCAQQYLK